MSYRSRRYRSSNNSLGLVAAIACFLALTVGFDAGCGALVANEGQATRALENQGFRNVEITGKQIIFVGFSGCGDDDAAKVKARATNANDQRVDAYVCEGFLKGATVRTGR